MCGKLHVLPVTPYPSLEQLNPGRDPGRVMSAQGGNQENLSEPHYLGQSQLSLLSIHSPHRCTSSLGLNLMPQWEHSQMPDPSHSIGPRYHKPSPNTGLEMPLLWVPKPGPQIMALSHDCCCFWELHPWGSRSWLWGNTTGNVLPLLQDSPGMPKLGLWPTVPRLCFYCALPMLSHDASAPCQSELLLQPWPKWVAEAHPRDSDCSSMAVLPRPKPQPPVLLPQKRDTIVVSCVVSRPKTPAAWL